MKKIICLVLMFAMVTSCITVFADNNLSQAMEDVLALVKQKVNVPENLTEFTAYTNENVLNGKFEYSFLWQDEDGKAHMEVSCNESGRITGYYFYDSSLKSEKKLSVLSQKDILDFADEFLKKTIPEAFSGDVEKLVFDSELWSVNNLNYSLRYIRMHNGIQVKDNDVSLSITVCNDVPYVRSMNAYLNSDTEFDDVPEELDGHVQKYKEAFPVEIIYKDDVQSYWKNINTDGNVKTVLLYRHKDNNAGYILAKNGEVAEEEFQDSYGGSGGATNEKFEASADAALRQEVFTEQELAELDKIKNVIPKEKAEEILRKLPYIGWDKNLQMTMYEIRRAGERYMVFTEFSNEDKSRNIYAVFEGENGELIDLYNRIPYPQDNGTELTDAQKQNAERKIDEFLEATASDQIKYNYSLQSSVVQGKRVYRDYDRVVLGVRYISDGVIVEYDTDAGMIVNYRMDFEKNREFKSIEACISAEEAYSSIMEISPLKRLYVKVDGRYQVCYTSSQYGVEVDAFTGEQYLPYGKDESYVEYNYSDLEGHWVKPKVEKLAEAQIGFKGDEFNPDVPATQTDVLRLIAAGVRYKSYLDYDVEDMYDEFIEEGILTEEEKAPEGQVKREDAFKYMVRLDGLENVAKLYNIFKVEYEDGYLLSTEKTGYAAILTGMNIVCGNGGKLRPDEPITRAEVAVMVYNYMVK